MPHLSVFPISSAINGLRLQRLLSFALTPEYLQPTQIPFSYLQFFGDDAPKIEMHIPWADAAVGPFNERLLIPHKKIQTIRWTETAETTLQ